MPSSNEANNCIFFFNVPMPIKLLFKACIDSDKFSATAHIESMLAIFMRLELAFERHS